MKNKAHDIKIGEENVTKIDKAKGRTKEFCVHKFSRISQSEDFIKKFRLK